MIRAILILLCGLVFLPSPVSAEKVKAKLHVFPFPPRLSASIQFYEPSGNNILDADEVGKLIIKVQNEGKGDAFDVKAEVRAGKSLTGLAYSREISFGTIAAGKGAAQELLLTASENLATDLVNFAVEIREANGFDFDANPLKISFNTKAFEPPRLVVADIGIEDQNKNSRVEPMEIVELTVRVQNLGHGDGRNVTVDVVPGKNVFLAGDAVTHFELGNLQAGKFKDVKFMFYTNTLIKNGEKIPINIEIKDRRPKFSSSYPLDLAMNAPQKRSQEVIVKAEEIGKRPDVQLATGLSVDVDMNVPEGEKAGRYDIAVIIGNKNYSASGIPNVDFADRDARIMREYLLRTFGYDPENILYAEDATFAKFNEFFGSDRDPKGKLFKFIRKGVSKVFIYYVGHGAPSLEDNEAYFVPVDANPQYISSNGYKLHTFYANLAQLPASKITIVLDACFSGNSEKGMLFKNISPGMLKVQKEFQSPQNSLLFTSAAMDQVSAWYPEKKHSLFTYYFLKGLQGDADVNKDKKITVREMKEYLKEHVPYMAGRLSGIDQQPMVMGNDSEVLVQLKK